MGNCAVYGGFERYVCAEIPAKERKPFSQWPDTVVLGRNSADFENVTQKPPSNTVARLREHDKQDFLLVPRLETASLKFCKSGPEKWLCMWKHSGARERETFRASIAQSYLCAACRGVAPVPYAACGRKAVCVPPPGRSGKVVYFAAEGFVCGL